VTNHNHQDLYRLTAAKELICQHWSDCLSCI